MAMVRMIMGDDDAIDVDDICRKELLAQVRAAIDQQPFAGTLNQNR
jgi:hypothetical protein